MKRILKSLLIAMAVMTPFITPVCAQENSAVADVPFAFIAGRQTMPAGRYVVSEMRLGSSTFSLRNAKSGVFLQLGSNETGDPAKPSLTFVCYGKDCVLAKVTPPNDSNAHALSQSDIEKYRTHHVGVAAMVRVKLSVGR
jgi:hypothetical protein